MAVHNDLSENLKLGIDDAWEQKSGKQVEDFICRNILVGGTYDSTSEKLILVKGGYDEKGEPLDSIKIDVSVIEPSYIYGIVVYGLKIDGVIYTGESLLTQYRAGRKIELGIAIRSVADRAGTQSTIFKEFETEIKFNGQNITTDLYPINHSYFKLEGQNLVLDIPAEENVNDIIYWVPVTDFFKKSFKEKVFEVSFKVVENNIVKTYSAKLATKITNEVIQLTYSGDIVIKSDQVEMAFDPSTTNANNYHLEGFIGTSSFKNNSGDLFIRGLSAGLNQISVRAVNDSNQDVYTDWFNIDVIYAQEGFKDTVIAVNGVSSKITNNGIATLYELVIYSPNKEEVSITTYLENEVPGDNPQPTTIIKSEIINPSVYDEENITTSTYKKYMEVTNTDTNSYLLVEKDGEFYKFFFPYTDNGTNYIDTLYYKTMQVENIIEEYTKVAYSTKYNFDQITGQSNNVFVTEQYATALTPATVNSIEASDGWYDNDGRSYFKVSAQDIPVFINPLQLNLGNNFTLEFGVKTYNTSDIKDTIITLGKLQIRPTMVCWDLNQGSMSDKDYKEAFLARVAKFQEGVETHITITLNSNWCIADQPDFYYPDYLRDDQALFEQYVRSTTGHLLRIYINGGIDREFILSDAEVQELKNSTLQILTRSADIDFYLFRIYNNISLNFSEILRNYISFLPNKTGEGSKEECYNKNDILNDQGLISWQKCLGKLNTLLYVFPENSYFPNRFWGGDDKDINNDLNKKAHVSLFINYADPIINTKYGGRLNHLQVKGQGSSAMRYLIWNVGSQMKKHKDENDEKIDSYFTPQGILYPNGIPENYQAVDSLRELENCYHMPTYSDQVDTTEYNYKKMVGKVNYASSMQSHKLGACKLYDDAYKKNVKALPSGGRKAVHEEPYMYFFIETNLSNDAVANLTWEEVLAMADQIKFMGFQTWGPGKGDSACSGFDEELTPEYLMLEGGENGDESVNFLVPWHSLQRLTAIPGTKTMSSSDLNTFPVIDKESSLISPQDKLLIDDESVVQIEDGAWDIDFGVEEIEKDEEAGILAGYFKFADDSEGYNVINSLKKFREFYDFVYLTDFTFVVESSSVTSPNDSWDKYKKHLVQSSKFFINEQQVTSHNAFDVYRWDPINRQWVPAGLYYTDPGTDPTKYNPLKWERLNYRNYFYGYEHSNSSASAAALRTYLKNLFTNNIGNYIDTDDVSFHQAFIKFLLGTDNRAKNTYFQIIGPIYAKNSETGELELTNKGDYKIRLIGDDLDTIFATDNNGLQSKDYNLIEDSYNNSYDSAWGDAGNIFFKMYDICFEEDIQNKLQGVMDMSGMTSSNVSQKGTYFYRNFFKTQEDFPIIAYNHTAKIYYENAYAILNASKLNDNTAYSFDYAHNGVEPLGQSHGSCLECERQFMKERIGFLSGYALSCLDNKINVSGGTGGDGGQMKLLLEFTSAQDFYPSYVCGNKDTTYKSVGDLNEYPGTSASSYEDYQKNALINRYVAKQDIDYTVSINDSGLHQWLNQVNLFKTLSITGLTLNSLQASFTKAIDFEIDNNKILENSSLFGSDWPGMSITDTITRVQLPVVENLSLKNMTLPDTLDLTAYYKLQTLDLSNSVTKYVEFPQTGHFANATIPSTITQFKIYNNPGLTENSIVFEGYDNIETVFIDCAKCGSFNVAAFCENLSAVSLNSVTLRNVGKIKPLYITEETLLKLIQKTCIIEGELTIVDTLGSTTPKNISFKTKQILVNTFGDITDSNNPLHINYESTEIKAGFTCNTEANAFYNNKLGGTQDFSNLFSITVDDGNDVSIISKTNPFNPDVNGYLDINYSIVSGNSKEVSVDVLTGQVTVTATPSPITSTIKITIKTDYGRTYTNTCTVSFVWVAPQLGDFAYADGSFGSYYNTSKTLIGLVYAVEGDSTSGTAYIIGKEYSNDTEHYTGYTTNEVNADASVSSIPYQAYLLSQYVGNLKLGDYQPSINVDDLNIVLYDEITISKGEDIMNIPMTGKEETLAYITLVNGVLLEKFATDSNISYDDGIYYIKSIGNLNRFCTTLNKNGNGSSELNSALVYPYFYSSYLYEPSVATGEQLDDQYKQGNWYSPSIGELSRIIYYRGYSVGGSNFTAANMVRQDISNSIPSGGTDLTTPIFSLALKAMNNANFPDVWNVIFGSGNQGSVNNITTRPNGDSISTNDNYSYQVETNYSNSIYTYRSVWVYGKHNTDYWGTAQGQMNAYRYTKHKGIPFTQYNYKNPQE